MSEVSNRLLLMLVGLATNFKVAINVLSTTNHTNTTTSNTNSDETETARPYPTSPSSYQTEKRDRCLQRTCYLQEYCSGYRFRLQPTECPRTLPPRLQHTDSQQKPPMR
ncbi:hypothetical protein M758_7G136500 [Ceratodon purpureus]|nr:hypothetical protein M758_7G136500 [Ceratodon purpureus]